MKRQLNEDEVKYVKSGMASIEKEVEYVSAQAELFKLQIDKLLRLNYERVLDDFKGKLQEAKALLEQHTGTLEILDKQLKEGVDIKEKKEDK